MHKTQVFLSPEGDHYRTRLTHTLEVAQVARTITRALNLNEDLTEAIALGHDLGHTPFGHNGESILNGIHPGGFRHNEQSLRVVDVLESSQGREGMNLTYEVRDGILNHSGSDMPSTLEGEVVRISDRIAYINHDIDDALRSGVITLDDFPSEALNLFGERHSRRIDNMVNNVIDASDGNDHIRMDDEGAAVRKIVPFMKNLQTLDMDTCNVSNEAMALIRDENPSVNVIWRIWFAGYTARTDVERILASSQARGGKVTNEDARVLKYCAKVKYLDLGHNEVLSDISFTASMPDLEVAIFAINDIDDISALANCPNLEYLEINSTNVTDLTPLSNATSLRHLNIGRCVKMPENNGSDELRPRVTDISPLFGLKDLERLYIGNLTAPGIPKEQLDTMAKAMGIEKQDSEGDYCDSRVSPEGLDYDYCRINVSSGDPSQGTWRTAGYRPDWVWNQWVATGVFNDPLNERYKLLREQFGYDTVEQSYSLPKNDPLY